MRRRTTGRLIIVSTIVVASLGFFLWVRNPLEFVEVFVCSVVVIMSSLGARIGFMLLKYKSERPISIQEIRKRVQKRTQQS